VGAPSIVGVVAAVSGAVSGIVTPATTAGAAACAGAVPGNAPLPRPGSRNPRHGGELTACRHLRLQMLLGVEKRVLDQGRIGSGKAV